MIDVMFFLLASYLLASLSMQRLDALPITLPHGTASPLANTPPLTLSIDRQDRLAIDGHSVALEQLAGEVHRDLHGDATLIVAADDKATQGAVTRAMLEARKAGAQALVLVIRHE